MKNFVPEEYFVLYFDLLGVREKLFNGIDAHCPTVDRKKQEEINLTSLAIVRYLSAMRNLHRRFIDPQEFIAQIVLRYPEVDQTALANVYHDQASRLATGVRQGSDTTMLYVKNNCEMATFVVLYWLQVLPIEIFKAMSDGILIRGSISLGTAWEVEKGCLFGPIFEEVSRYEKDANCPRIVATDHFMDHCEHASRQMRAAGNFDECTDIRSLFVREDEMWVWTCFSKENLDFVNSEDQQLLSKAAKYVFDSYNALGNLNENVASKFRYLCDKFNGIKILK